MSNVLEREFIVDFSDYLHSMEEEGSSPAEVLEQAQNWRKLFQETEMYEPVIDEIGKTGNGIWELGMGKPSEYGSNVTDTTGYIRIDDAAEEPSEERYREVAEEVVETMEEIAETEVWSSTESEKNWTPQISYDGLREGSGLIKVNAQHLEE